MYLKIFKTESEQNEGNVFFNLNKFKLLLVLQIYIYLILDRDIEVF